jgi:ATP-binding cassette subfamily B protein
MLVGDLLAAGGGALTIGGFLVSLTAISPVMVAVVVAGTIPVVIAELALARRRASLMWGLSPLERREFFYSGLLSSAEAAKEIRLFGIGPFLRRRMLTERSAGNELRRRQDRRELAVQGGLGMLSTTVAGGGLVWAVIAAQAGQLTIGDLTLFVATVAGVQAALIGLATTGARAHQQLLLFTHYVTVLRTKPDLPVAARPVAVPPLRHGIELRNVWFRYSSGHPWILSGVNLFIPRGATVALVGRNGAGKSTLVKLLCRFYDPTRGAIYWDGVDLREFDVDDVRRRIGAVFQDFMHYDLSARENVALGDIDALEDSRRISRAARLAGIHDTLRGLPRGYDTLLTRLFSADGEDEGAETGVLLSGGQWQRVALARAFLRARRDLMLLDEPSSGLDPLAEQEIHSTVRKYRAGSTSVLISHRLGVLRDADVIIVLGAGRVMERGSHHQLLALDGEYAALFRSQARGYLDSVEVPA